MTIHSHELVNVAQHLAEDRNLQATIVGSFKGSLYAGGSALLGGLIGGPRGLLVGGIIGSLLGYTTGQGEYKSIASVLSEMNPVQKERLATCLREAIKDVHAEDAVILLGLLQQNQALVERVLLTFGNFLQNEMSMALEPVP